MFKKLHILGIIILEGIEIVYGNSKGKHNIDTKRKVIPINSLVFINSDLSRYCNSNDCSKKIIKPIKILDIKIVGDIIIYYSLKPFAFVFQ